VHRDIEVDFDDENNRFIRMLSGQYTPKKYKEVRPSFDFGAAISTSNTGEDRELLEAISFLRFREETGHPCRIHNYVDGTKAAAAAAERIVGISVSWAVITLVRAADVKSLDNVIIRPLLSVIPFETSDKWALFYTKMEIDT